MIETHPTHQPLDAELAAVVAAMRANHAPPPFSGRPEQARERMRRAMAAVRERTSRPVVGAVEDCVAAHGGLCVPVRVYRPVSRAAPLPTVLFFHGGGFVLGTIDLWDDIVRKLCGDLQAVIVSVEYRLAPEHPFPAAHEDALAAALWTLANAESLGGDPRRVAVAGESSGGNLAASTALLLRDRDRHFAAQLLVVPGVDLARDTARIEARGIDYPMLTPSDLRDVSRLYMGDKAAQAAAFPPSPLRARSFAGLPPTVVAIAGHDPLREEALAYARLMRRDGVPVDVLQFPDMFHPFLGFFQSSAAARRANDEVGRAFANCLAGQSPGAARGT